MANLVSLTIDKHKHSSVKCNLLGHNYKVIKFAPIEEYKTGLQECSRCGNKQKIWWQYNTQERQLRSLERIEKKLNRENKHGS